MKLSIKKPKFWSRLICTSLLACMLSSACTSDASQNISAIESSDDTKVNAARSLVKQHKNAEVKVKPTMSTSVLANEHLGNLYIGPESLAKKLKFPVNDFTNTLSAAERKQLDDKISSIHSEGILQIGIVIINTTAEMPIFDYAMSAANNWALGTPKNNNGLFILLALDDKEIYILTGTDAEDELTDERVKTIIDEDITPYFPDAHYATGLSKGIDALVEGMRKN